MHVPGGGEQELEAAEPGQVLGAGLQKELSTAENATAPRIRTIVFPCIIDCLSRVESDR